MECRDLCSGQAAQLQLFFWFVSGTRSGCVGGCVSAASSWRCWIRDHFRQTSSERAVSCDVPGTRQAAHAISFMRYLRRRSPFVSEGLHFGRCNTDQCAPGRRSQSAWPPSPACVWPLRRTRTRPGRRQSLRIRGNNGVAVTCQTRNGSAAVAQQAPRDACAEARARSRRLRQTSVPRGADRRVQGHRHRRLFDHCDACERTPRR